jgi:hypothetical protein
MGLTLNSKMMNYYKNIQLLEYLTPSIVWRTFQTSKINMGFYDFTIFYHHDVTNDLVFSGS